MDVRCALLHFTSSVCTYILYLTIFFVLIPIRQKQLDPDALWIFAIFSFSFPPGVLATYLAQFLLLLETLPTVSHVKGLDNVTNISSLLALDPILQEELLSGFLPSWFNLIFSQDFGWHSFTTELLDVLQSESRTTFFGADMGSYLKATHQMKDWWWPRLLVCIEECIDPTVVEFARKVLLNLSSMQDSDFYTVLYIGESISFLQRMSRKDPARFLSWFPATHTFMLARLSPVSRNKRTNKAACFGLESIMAILMSYKLPGMSYEEGRCFNYAHCGCRFWGNKSVQQESLTYVSFEKVDGEFLPIMVHPSFKHIEITYGQNKISFFSSMIIKTPFLPHPRVKKVFLKAFQSYKDENELDLLFQQAEERGGEDISHKLRKEVDLMYASRGIFVSSNGKFAENGGVLGVDYFSCPSIRSAGRDKRINHNFGKKPNQRTVTEQIIRENMDERGECFIPWTRGGVVAGRMQKGILIKFNGYMYARTGGDARVRVYPSEEI